MGGNHYTASDNVAKGILVLFERPEIVEALKTKKRLIDFTQQELDLAARALRWAELRLEVSERKAFQAKLRKRQLRRRRQERPLESTE